MNKNKKINMNDGIIRLHLDKTIAIFVMAVGIFAAVPVAADTKELPVEFDVKIIQTNDIHARVEENEEDKIIGMERVGGIIKSIDADSDIALALDAGDTFHGQPIATLVKGDSVARLMKACGYDAMTAGNHDWSYGKERLKELGETAGVTMLAGNITDDDGDSFFDETSYTKEVTKDGQQLKIGVFGVIDPQMYQKTTPSNVEGLTFTDPVVYAEQAAADLREDECDIVIALSHTYNPAGLAEQVDGVDLWLCGHEHVEIDTSVTTPDGSTAYVSESGYYLYSMGLIDLKCEISSDGEVQITDYEKTTLDYETAQSYEKSEEVTDVFDQIQQENAEELNKEVGTLETELDGVWENVRIDQTNLGNVITDAYLDITGADIAFENAGGIRASIEAGVITYGDVINVSPYGNYIVTKTLTGKQIREILETSMEIQHRNAEANDSGDWNAWPEDSGSYLQFGGMTVTCDQTKEQGKRVVSIKIKDEEIDESKEYTVAVNNYLAQSSSYPALAEAKETGEFSACDEALIHFISEEPERLEESAQDIRLLDVQ